MKKAWFLAALPAALLLALPSTAQMVEMPAGKWWKRPKVVEALQITADQQQRLDEVFAKNRRAFVDLKADVVHAHDWQTALLPVYVRLAEERHDTSLAVKTVFTVHNLAFQGVFPMDTFRLTGLPEEFCSVDHG